MFYIYCYTNKINQHKYVGQTNNLKRRYNEHLSASYNENSISYNSLFHPKIREYGIDNFDFEILETIYSNDREDANKQEQYWIEKKESYCGTGKGYNRDAGGSISKESKILTDNQLAEVRKLIMQGECYEDISKQYNISISFISNLNNGVYFKDENLTYPLFKYYKDDTDYDELIELLTNSTLSFSEIAKILNIGESTIKKINVGTLRHGLYPNYPIRKLSSAEMKANEIKKLLLETKYDFDTIAKIVKVSDTTVGRINNGHTHYDENLNYPLRKPVTTILG